LAWVLVTCTAATWMSGCGNLLADGGDTGAQVGCLVGDARCNSSGHRETCAAPGNWVASDFVCTTNVAVDDDTGMACATKADGQFRCWGGSGSSELPPGAYRRVQSSPHGPIGLTRDGRVVAPGIPVPADFPRIADLRSNNMWGGQGLCFRSALDGSFTVFIAPPMGPGVVVDPDADPLLARGFRSYGGPFLQASCAFEGMAFGVRSDGTAWTNISRVGTIAGPGWRSLALSLGFSCGLRRDGEVSCANGFLLPDETTAFAFNFPTGPYLQIATSYRLACAVSTTGNLTCFNIRGQVVPTPAGRYTFVDAGHHVVCAIRAEGTSACWQEWPATDTIVGDLVTRLDPIALPIDAGW
jgi:hypothetical protein